MANTIVELDIPDALAPDAVFLEKTHPSQEDPDGGGYTPTNPSDWLYRITVPEALVGVYRVLASQSGNTVGSGYVFVQDDEETYRASSDYTMTNNQLEAIYNKLLSMGVITVLQAQPVMAGRLESIVIGDSYLVENDNTLKWTTAPIPGFNLANTIARFGLRNTRTGLCLVVESAEIALVDDKWLIQIEITAEETRTLTPGAYGWSLDLLHEDSEITIDRSSRYRITTSVFEKFDDCGDGS
jgi:hypothetical protein